VPSYQHAVRDDHGAAVRARAAWFAAFLAIAIPAQIKRANGPLASASPALMALRFESFSSRTLRAGRNSASLAKRKETICSTVSSSARETVRRAATFVAQTLFKTDYAILHAQSETRAKPIPTNKAAAVKTLRCFQMKMLAPQEYSDSQSSAQYRQYEENEAGTTLACS